ncbi:MAG: hypothetical protein HOM55_10560 [Proteobacteria bacterium]|jgi:hypothetical protein|nr:hypothetical protein [Pseudomonadota bacterium]
MTNRDHLIEQHIQEYESRRKHLDELYERAHRATEHLDDDHETRSELKGYAEQKSELDEQTEKIKTMHVEDWREETVKDAGPIMAIWDVLAQRLEDFIERHE